MRVRYHVHPSVDLPAYADLRSLSSEDCRVLHDHVVLIERGRAGPARASCQCGWSFQSAYSTVHCHLAIRVHWQTTIMAVAEQVAA